MSDETKTEGTKETEKALRDNLQAARAKLHKACREGKPAAVESALKAADDANAKLHAKIGGKLARFQAELGE